MTRRREKDNAGSPAQQREAAHTAKRTFQAIPTGTRAETEAAKLPGEENDFSGRVSSGHINSLPLPGNHNMEKLRKRRSAQQHSLKLLPTPLPRTAPLLTKLLQRKSREHSLINKQLADQIVRGLLIPMFASALPRVPPARTSRDFKLEDPSFSVARGLQNSLSVASRPSASLNDKKLSKLLAEEIERFREEKERKALVLHRSCSQKQELNESLRRLKCKLSNAVSCLKVLQFSGASAPDSSLKRFAALNAHCLMKQQLLALTPQTHSLVQQLAEEQRLNTQLQCENINKKHWMSSYTFASIVMGNQLQHLYFALPAQRVPPLLSSFSSFSSFSARLECHEPKQLPGDSNTEILVSRAVLGLRHWAEVLSHIKRLKHTYIMQSDQGSKELQLLQAEICRRKVAIDHLETLQEQLSTQHLRASDEWNKIKRHNAPPPHSLNFCRTCGQQYSEAENSHTVCTHHPSSFEQGFYWCCGQHRRAAPGCAQSRHLSAIYKERSPLTRPSICASCRCQGHLSSKCDKDPNVQLSEDMVGEYERLYVVFSRAWKRRANHSRKLEQLLCARHMLLEEDEESDYEIRVQLNMVQRLTQIK